MIRSGHLLLLVFAFLVNACATGKSVLSELEEKEETRLRKFAYANCLFWYFKGKGYEEADIRSIGAGFVEMSSQPAEKFQEIALAVRDFEPALETKDDIDPSLYKCFILEEDEELRRLISDL